MNSKDVVPREFSYNVIVNIFFTVHYIIGNTAA